MSQIIPVDLASLDTVAAAEQGAVFRPEHPVTGDPLGIEITLAGADSAIFRRAQNALLDRRMAGRKKKLSSEEIQAESSGLLAACTLSWKGMVVDGQEVPCGRDAAGALYLRFPWLREQADAFISERRNYLGD